MDLTNAKNAHSLNDHISYAREPASLDVSSLAVGVPWGAIASFAEIVFGILQSLTQHTHDGHYAAKVTFYG